MIYNYYKSKKDIEVKKVDGFLSKTWIYVESPSDLEISRLVKKLKLDEGLLRDALDPFEVPRLEKDGGIIYFFVRAPIVEDGVLSTIPLLVVIGRNFVVTVINKPSNIFEKFLNNKIHFSTENKVRLFLQIFGEINNSYDSSLVTISRIISQASADIEKIENKDIVKFVNYEQITNDYLSRLIQNNSVLNRVKTDRSIKFNEEDEELLDDLILANGQLIELSKNSLQSVKNIRDSYSTILSNNLNRVIKLLTSLTIILNVPTMVAGLWGMNVNVPFAESIYAFIFVLVIIVLICAILIKIFRKRDWI